MVMTLSTSFLSLGLTVLRQIVMHVKDRQTKTDKLLAELTKRITDLSNPLVLLWLGTCDFTRLEHPFVVLKPDADVPRVCNNFNIISNKIHSANSTAEVLYFECPMYSIEMWNEIKEHAEPAQFKDDDNTRVSKIKSLNSFFHDKNGEANKIPKISEDLNKNTKSKKGHSRYFYNYKELTRDGIL